MSEQLNPYEAPQEELRKIAPEEDEVSKSLKADLKRFLWTVPFVMIFGALLMTPIRGFGIRLSAAAVLAEIVVIFMIVVRVKTFNVPKTRLDAFLIRWGVFPIYVMIATIYSIVAQ
jgi:hypothetical protein